MDPLMCPRKPWGAGIALWVSARARVVVTDSHYSRTEIQRHLGLPEAKIRVLPIGVGPSYKPTNDPGKLDSVRQRYELKKPFLFYVGNFKPHKNVGALIQAYAALDLSFRSTYELVLGGRRDRCVGELEGLAEQLGVGNEVRFVGQIDEEDLPHFYSAAELFVFPSLFEGFGLPPLEAMACGTAVVCSNRTSLPEVVGDAGRLVDPSDVETMCAAIEALLRDQSSRRELVRRGLKRAAEFRSEVVFARHLELLENVGGATSGGENG